MKGIAPTPKIYLVGAFDIVGLSNIFQSFNGLPTEPNAAFDGALKETLAFIKWFRSTYLKWFEIYPFEKNLLARYEEKLHHIEALLSRQEINLQAFADLIIPYTELTPGDNDLPAISAIMRMFHSAGSLFVISMASGRPVRGGLDAESAIERTSEEIYGRALNEALALAMRLADYPRIAVGPHLRPYLKKITQTTERSQFAEQAKELATLCLKLIIDDTDGQAILHYLSPDFKPPTLDTSSFVQAREFINQQPSVWTTAGQPHLVERYQRLQEYWLKYGAHRKAEK